MKGDVLGVNSADLRAVSSLRQGTKPVGDPFMKTEIDALETDSVRNLQSYAATLMQEEDFNYANQFASKEDLRSNTINGTNAEQKMPGQIFSYRKGAVTVQVMYIGVIGNEYIPLGTFKTTQGN